MALIAPQEAIRKRAAELVGIEQFIVVHVYASPETCQARHANNQTATVEEVALDYELPTNPDLLLNTNELTTMQCVNRLIELLESRGILA